MTEFYPPPSPSTPRNLPWTQIEQIIDALKVVSVKLDSVAAAIAAASGVAVPTTLTVDGKVDRLIQRLDDLIGMKPAAVTAGVPEINHAGWTHGTTVVQTAGKAEQLPDIKVPDGCELIVRGHPANTDDIYTGNSKAHASQSTAGVGEHITLAPGEALKLRVTNANVVFVDAAVSGEKAEWFVEQD